MADRIIHKRNLTTGNIPTTSSIEVGELAINVADGKLFLYQSGSIANKIVTVGESSSYAISSSYSMFANTASFITSSGVYGPYGSNSILTASYTETASISLATTENRILVLNQSGQNIAKGVVVHITASGNSSDTPRIITASYENDANSANTLGITSQLIANGSTGYVTTEGVVTGINTNAFQSGQLVYLGATGSIIGYAPAAPLHSVRLGQVIRHQSVNGSIYVRIDNGYELNELHDVFIDTGSLTSGQSLVRSGSVWINSNSLTGSLFGTASYATVANSVNDLNQNVFISGSLTVLQGATIYGSSSFQYVTSSQLAVSASFISVNVFEPVERFGGLKVYDSGSSTATASLAWDSLHNHWVYQNVSGSTYTGGMLLSGPRNTGSLGDEPNLTTWYIPRSDGGDHLNDSQIYSSGSTHIVTGSLTVTAGVTGSFTGSYTGDGAGLYNIPASGIVGLNLSQISSGSVSASISPNSGLQVNTNVTATSFTGSLFGTASWAENAITASYVLNAVSSSFALTASYLSGYVSPFPYTGSALITGSLGVTGSSSIRSTTTSSTLSAFNITYSGSNINILDIKGDGRILLGYSSSNNTTGGTPQYAIAIGANAKLTGASETYGSPIAIGYSSSAGGVSIGNGSSGAGIAIGHGAASKDYESVVIGGTNTGGGFRTVTIGIGASNTGYQGSAIGYDVNNTADGAYVVGTYFNNSLTNSFIYGSNLNYKFIVTDNSNLVLANNRPITEANKATYFDTSATNTITIITGSAPSTNISNAFQLYASTGSISANPRPHFRTGNGTTVWLGDESRLFNITASRTTLSASNATSNGPTLTVYGSGSTQPVFTVQGSQGELFSVTDSLSGSLFSVNDISGLPILEVFPTILYYKVTI